MHHALKAGIAAAFLCVTLPGIVAAAEPLAFVLPAEDGYGIGECFAGGSACGQGMADGWCEAHGHLKAVAFGNADVTGSTPGALGRAEPAGIAIRCSD